MALEFEIDLADGVSDSAGAMSKSVGGLVSQFGELVPGIGAAVAAVGAAAAALGGGAALVVGTISKVADGVEQSNLLFAKFGAPTIAMFDDLGKQVGKTREQLGDMATQFRAMGITDVPALKQALLAASSAEAMMGQQGVSALQSLMSKVELAKQAHTGLKLEARGLGKQLADAGVSLDEVAAKMGETGPQLAAQLKAGTVSAQKFGDALQQAVIEKGAGPLGELANSFGAMWEQAKQTLFTSIFDPGTDSGKALRFMIDKIKDAFVVLGQKAIPIVRMAILQLIIWGLKFYIMVKSNWGTISFILKGIGVALLAVVAVVTVLAGIAALPFLLMAAAGAAVWALIGGLIAVWGNLAAAVVGFVSGAAKALTDWVSSAVDIAEAFVDGLVTGIKNGVAKVVGAVTDLGAKAKGALKGLLGISSPSKVMMELGAHTAGGFAAGISAGSGQVEGAAGTMAAAATPTASKGGSSASSGSLSVDVGGIHIDGAGKNAEAIAEELVATLFERIALARGL